MLSLPSPALGRAQGAEGRGLHYSNHKRVFGRSDPKCLAEPGMEEPRSRSKKPRLSYFPFAVPILPPTVRLQP